MSCGTICPDSPLGSPSWKPAPAEAGSSDAASVPRLTHGNKERRLGARRRTEKEGFMRFLRVFALSVSAGVLTMAALAAGPEIGTPAPAFTLTTLDGQPFSLTDAARKHKAVVVMFIATQCPYSNAYNDRMRDMAAAYEKRDVLFVGINSNKTEPAEEVASHAKKHGFAFPLMKDPGNRVADLYDAKHTPEIYVVDPQGKLRYHGRIDENYENASGVTSPDLKNALEELLAGKPIQKAETKAFGCSIKRG
jgi:peroxiredoxin